MIQTNISIPDHPDTEVRHIGPDELSFVCVCEALDNRVNGSVSWHWHQFFEIAYVAEGALECHTPNQVLRLNKGEAVFINSGVLHMYKKTAVGPCTVYAHIFDNPFLSGTLSSGIYQKYIYPIASNPAVQLQPIRPENRHQNLMLEAVSSMIDLSRREPFGYEFQIQAQLGQFWCRLLTLADTQTPNTGHSNTDIRRMKTMLSFIHGNYARPLTLKEIADAAAISERECSRCFQRCFRESAVSYLNKYRIRVAAGMLLEGQESIQSVSRQCGFHSVSYFGKHFRSLLGCTPKEYRKKASAPEQQAEHPF